MLKGTPALKMQIYALSINFSTLKSNFYHEMSYFVKNT